MNCHATHRNSWSTLWNNHGEIRPERCIPVSPYCARTSQIYMERSVLPVPITAIWSGLSPENLYEAPSFSGSRDAIEGHKYHYVPGQYPCPGQLGRFGSSCQAAVGVGFQTQSEEAHLITDTNHQILGARGQFPSDDNSPSSEQDGENLRRSEDMCLTNRNWQHISWHT